MRKFIFQLILEIILFCLLFFNVLVLKKLDTILNLAYLLGFLILLLAIVRYKKPIKRRAKDVNFIVIGLSIIALGIMYLVGLFTGFVNTPSPISKTPISLGRWFFIIVTVVITELIRYMLSLIETRKQKKYLITDIIMLLNYVLIDMTIATKVYSLNAYGQICEFFCIFFVQSVAKNLLLNNLSKKYGYGPCLYYRLFMDLYLYILPQRPLINNFIEAVAFLIFPYIVYITLQELTEKRKVQLSKSHNNSEYVGNTIVMMMVVILVMLVSCEFKYGMLAVGSKSMTGTINKGDAIIYKKYEQGTPLKEGQIIVFSKNNVMIIHRITKAYKIDDKEEVYQTKGDANKNDDNWLVKQREVVGIVDTRILFVAWPSVFLNEIF